MFHEKLFRWGRAQFGEAINRHRGVVPESVVEINFGLETGFNVYSVATDTRLTEVGLSGIELVRFFDHDADPFSAESAIWLGCRDLDADAWRYRERYLATQSEDIWFLMYLRFSIGRGAVAHILQIVDALSPGRHPVSLTDRIITWSQSPDFLSPRHMLYWGRQSAGLVRKRIKKQALRLAWAKDLGPIDSWDPTRNPPAERRPCYAACFPEAIKWIAHKKKQQINGEEHAHLHHLVKAYAKQRKAMDASTQRPAAAVPLEIKLACMIVREPRCSYDWEGGEG